MPIISQTGKLGRSIDAGDLFAQRKRNIINLEIASKKSLGVFKAALYSRDFGIANLQSQNGLDEYLNAGRIGSGSDSTPTIDPALITLPGPGTPNVGTGTPVPGPFAAAGTGIVFTSPLNTPTSLHVFETDAGGTGLTYFTTYANGIWVLTGYGTSTNQTNIYYGPSLTSLLPLTLFGGGFGNPYGIYPNSKYPYVTYGNGTWVFCGKDISGSGYNVYYGPNPGNLRALPIFGNGGSASHAIYANNTWVICGQDKSNSGYNVYFGPSLTSLTPLIIFGTFGSNYGYANWVTYANFQWAIGGRDESSSKINVYYGSSLTTLLPLPIFQYECTKIVYYNTNWVLCGSGLSSGRTPSFHFGSLFSSLVASTLTIGNNYSCIEANFANGIWVLGFNTNTQTNVFYGPDLANLIPLTLFGAGGSARSIVYANGIWAIGGLNYANNSINIYYGANIASLTPKTTKLGFYLAYQNGLWLAAGQSSTSENNFAYGADLATI